MSEHYFNYLGNKIYYAIYGELGNSIPLVCIHGGPGISHHYLLSLKEISNERPVIFYDQLGCGNSDRPTDNQYMNITYYYEELKAFIEHLGVEKVHLLGQSFGGTLALEYLLNTQCAKVQSVVFASPALSAVQFTLDAQKRLAELPNELKAIIESHNSIEELTDDEANQIEEYFLEHFVIGNAGQSEELAKSMEVMNAEIYNTMWGPSEFVVSGNLKNYDRTNELHTITTPTLFTVGRNDEVSADTCTIYSNMMPNADVVVFENSAHMAHVEEQVSYISELNKFFIKAESR